jgi:hypothetical protein
MSTHGYHKNAIQKGTVGQVSKILEECYEAQDAEEQGNKIMELCELSDIYLAIKKRLEVAYPEMTMDDIRIMAEATERAFKGGYR